MVAHKQNLAPAPAQQSATVFGNITAANAAAHNDIIGGGPAGEGGAGRMRDFDGQGRGRAILPRAAASAGSSRSPFSGNNFRETDAQYSPRVIPHPDHGPRQPTHHQVITPLQTVSAVRANSPQIDLLCNVCNHIRYLYIHSTD